MITHGHTIQALVAHPPVSSDGVYVKIAAPVQLAPSPSKIPAYPPAAEFSELTPTREWTRSDAKAQGECRARQALQHHAGARTDAATSMLSERTRGPGAHPAKDDSRPTLTSSSRKELG
ncbi:hypothetical protein Nm8I071_24140 [Nonomuraea sp. TT08I-71]|nr:hypothetical protein Nm8I071_24140 [Nonomuraea sp. TT08I-71]